MKIMKRSLSVFLSVLMIATLLTGDPFSVEAATTSGTTGDCTWTLDDLTGTLTISGEGKMGDYYYNAPWKSFATSIKNLIVENGVTYIGKNSFYELENLVNVSISETVITVEEVAFAGCSNMTEITLPNGTQKLGSYVFSDCDKLSSISLPNTLKSIGDGAFAWCDKLESVDIPESVKTIGTCPFKYNKGIKNINVDSKNTNYCTINGNLFTKNGKELIQYANGKSNNSFIVPNGVEVIGKGAFQGGENLVNISFPDSLITIKSLAFDFCENIIEFSIPMNVSQIDDQAFRYCSSVTGFSVDQNNQSFMAVDGVLFNKSKTKLIQYPFGKNDAEYYVPDGVVGFSKECFEGVKNLKTIHIPNSMTQIANQCFGGAHSLNAIYLPKTITKIGEQAIVNSGVKDIYYLGTRKEFEYITIADYNTDLISKTHYIDDDTIVPTCSISSTNNLASLQTAMLTMNDDFGVVGYYWGTNSSYNSNTYTSTTSTSITKTITSSGTYYLTVKDTSGNVSETKSITFYSTNLNANGGTLAIGTPSYVLTASGNSFTPTVPTRSRFEFVGWNTSSSATTGLKTITPTDNNTYYAIWKEVPVSTEAMTIATEPPTDVPEPTTEAPEVSTSVPTNPYTETTSSISEVSESITVSPEPTAVAPEPVTEVTEPTTAAPEPVSEVPEPTTVAPVSTTVAPTEPTENVVVHSKSKQYITAKSYTKSFGNKSFSLKAKTNGNGKLSYKSSNKKVVTVSSKGKIKIKGCGKATITIKASATDKCFAVTKKITITVKPGKVKLKAKKTYTKNGSYCIKQYFAKQKNCDGYEWQLSAKKNFPINYVRSKFISKSKKYIYQSAAYKGRKYYIRIRAYKKISRRKYNGKWSKTIVFKT